MESRILIIDGDADVRNPLADFIRSKCDCEVHEAADRAEARALLENFSYSLVLTDLSLTRCGLAGLDLIEEIVAAPFRPDIIAYSAYQNTRSVALSYGADTFLTKPLSLAEIGSIVDEFLLKAKHLQPRFPRAGISPRLDELLAEGGTRVYVQPIYQVECNRSLLKGVEFLTRGPAGTLFERPDVLFAYARAAHMEGILDRHCVRRALATAGRIPEQARVSINVHASTLCELPEFSDWLCKIAADEQVDTKRINIEIVEHSPAWNLKAFLQALDGLRRIDVKIALDDIGLGHSNYKMMVDARPDYFKLDRYFVNGCSTDRYRRAVVASVARLAADFGATVIAEGVETPADLQELISQSINLVQSFMFCSPKPVEESMASVLTTKIKPCSCSTEPRKNERQCPLKGMGLCVVDYAERDSRLGCELRAM